MGSVINLPLQARRIWGGRMRMRMFARMRRNQAGAVAIEFAIIAPVFFFLMFVITETALIFVAEQVMDNAVFETARLVRTGQVQKGGMSQEDFREEVCDRMSVFISCGSDFYLDVRSYPDFASMSYGAPLEEDNTFEDEGTYDFGEESEIVVVRAYYKWSTTKIFGDLSLSTPGMTGKRLIGSFVAFRNEPYGED